MVVLQIDEVDSIHVATERLMGSMGDTPEMVRQARILALVCDTALVCVASTAALFLELCCAYSKVPL